MRNDPVCRPARMRPFFRLAILAGVAVTFIQPAVAQQPPRTGGLYIVDADGSDWQKLLEVPGFAALGSPEWSRDGNYVAFDAYQSELGESGTKCRIFVAALDGSSLVNLGRGNMPSWSPGGRFLVCSRYDPNKGVWIIAVDGSVAKNIAPDGWGGQWSPDGRTIAYTRGLEFVLYDVSTDESRSFLTPLDDGQRSIYWNFTWSPTSDRLCYVVLKGDGSRSIVSVTVDDDDPDFTVHHTAERIRTDISWHPDGDRILFAMPHAEREQHQLFEFNPDTDDPPVVFPGQDVNRANTTMTWSPYGDQIIVGSWTK